MDNNDRARLASATIHATLTSPDADSPLVGYKLINNIAAVYGIPGVTVPSEPVDPASLTTIEEFEAAIMPIIERFGETTLEATKQMAHDLVPIVKALEASPIDKVYKDALLVKFGKRLDDLSTSIDGMEWI